MKYCPYCGKPVEDNHKFCYHCGEQMTGADAAVSQPEQQTQQPVNTSATSQSAEQNTYYVNTANQPQHQTNTYYQPKIKKKGNLGKILGIVGGVIAALFLIVVVVGMLGDGEYAAGQNGEPLFVLKKNVSDDKSTTYIDFDENCNEKQLKAVEERIKKFDSNADISISTNRITATTNKSLHTKYGEEKRLFAVDGSFGLAIEKITDSQEKVYEIDKEKIYVIERAERYGSVLSKELMDMELTDNNISVWGTANDMEKVSKVHYVRLVVEENEAKKIMAVIEKADQYDANVLAVSDCSKTDTVYGGTELGTLLPAPKKSEEGYVDFYIIPEDMESPQIAYIISEIIYGPVFNSTMKVTTNPKLCGFMNQKGDIVIDFEYENANEPSEGMIAVKKDGKWGYIDEKGNVKIDFLYDSAYRFSNGFASVKKDDKWGLINKKGKVKIDLKYEDMGYFDEDVIPFKQDGKWGLMENDGTVKVKNRYDDMADFSDGVIAAMKGGKWGGIDNEGNTVIPFEFDKKFNFAKDTPTLVCKNGKYGFIDKSGNTVIPFDYSDGKDFSEGKAAVKKDGHFGFIDTLGNVVLPFECIWASSFSEGLVYIETDYIEPARFIDENANTVIEADAWLVEDFKNGLAMIKYDDGTECYVDRSGKRVGPAYTTYEE